MLRKKSFRILLLLVTLGAIGLAGYFYYELNNLKNNPQSITKKEVSDLVDKVSRLVLLPEKEIPTVATVSDLEKLKDQTFFAKAQKGDKVLIYAEAKKAYLYSVTKDRVIDIAPLNLGNKEESNTEIQNSNDSSLIIE